MEEPSALFKRFNKTGENLFMQYRKNNGEDLLV